MAQVIHDCPHCGAVNIAQVIHGQCYGPKNNYALCMCPRCARPTVFELVNANGEQLGSIVDVPYFTPEVAGYRVVNVWPKPIEPTKIDFLPEPVEKAFTAAERNYPSHGMEEAAGGSYGRAIDLAIKKIDPSLKGTLYARIDALAKAQKLTPDLAAWAHEIRELRNEALHEVESMSREDLTVIRGFTEMVLRYLFALPGMLQARKDEAGAPK